MSATIPSGSPRCPLRPPCSRCSARATSPGRERIHTRLDHPEWEHVHALAATITPAELVDPALPLDRIAWRLFNEEAEIRVLPPAPLARGCRCSMDHIRDVLGRFPADERAEMAEADGLIRVDCAFCARSFPVEPASLG